MNAINLQKRLPGIAANQMWLGMHNEADMVFVLSLSTPISPPERPRKGSPSSATCGQLHAARQRLLVYQPYIYCRHKLLQLMTREENLRFSRHKEIRGSSLRAGLPPLRQLRRHEAFHDAIPLTTINMGARSPSRQVLPRKEFEILVFLRLRRLCNRACPRHADDPSVEARISTRD